MNTPCNTEIFHQISVVVVHCLDLDTKFELTVRSVPVLKLKCLYRHICFPVDLCEQRLVVFLNSVIIHAKFAGVKSPCCIEVKSSAVFELIHFVCPGNIC